MIDEGLLDELAESLGGRALVNQMLQVYRDSLPERLENLRAASDPEALREAAHALRSPSAGFGIARLAARLRVVETAARAGRMAELGAALVAAAHADRALAGPPQRAPDANVAYKLHTGVRPRYTTCIPDAYRGLSPVCKVVCKVVATTAVANAGASQRRSSIARCAAAEPSVSIE